MTAADLITMVRDEASEWDTADVPDGYTTQDLDFAPGLRILRILNKWKDRLARDTQFNKCYFYIPLTLDVGEYTFTRRAGEIESASLHRLDTGYHSTLEFIDIHDLDDIYTPRWRDAPSSVPNVVYFIGTKAFGVYPKPSMESQVEFLAVSSVPDMVASTDILAPLYDADGNQLFEPDGTTPESGLPEMYHEIVAIGAASEIAAKRKNPELSKMLYARWLEGVESVMALTNTRQSNNNNFLPVSVGRYRRRFSGRGKIAFYVG